MRASIEFGGPTWTRTRDQRIMRLNASYIRQQSAIEYSQIINLLDDRPLLVGAVDNWQYLRRSVPKVCQTCAIDHGRYSILSTPIATAAIAGKTGDHPQRPRRNFEWAHLDSNQGPKDYASHFGFRRPFRVRGLDYTFPLQAGRLVSTPSPCEGAWLGISLSQ